MSEFTEMLFVCAAIVFLLCLGVIILYILCFVCTWLWERRKFKKERKMDRFLRRVK